MLSLKNIDKDYVAGSTVVHALRGISVDFRSCEFVSMLGPSGCGKTTLLNIIGGLDKYTSGDLVIDGVSTKEYKDRDWDTYRNHSIGFVFQSYYLIPHQTVLQNVEMTLTLSGVPKAERRKRAIEALKAVGLENQINKRPNQMSGGQMQRVAIARALVNDPDIILADEPTGALDTETSVTVMEILKQVAKDRLVIMVTHNPELAEQYSTRIIRMLDGEIIGDTAPLSDSELVHEAELDSLRSANANGRGGSPDSAGDAERPAKAARTRKSKMSFWTAFKLSLKNLFTKKGRTFLTSFAGSIGIIGIALILAVSTGMTGYIDRVQEQTLSSYPLSIQSTAMDLSQLVASMMETEDTQAAHEEGKVYNRSTIYRVAQTVASTAQAMTDNDLNAFKKFLEKEIADEDSKLHDAVAGLQYQYDLELSVYAKRGDEIFESDVNSLLNEVINRLFSGNAESTLGGYYPSMMTFSMDVWQELLPGSDGSYVNDLLYDQYDLVAGKWPNSYDEIVLVLNENNEISDISLYALGLLGDDYVERIAESFTQDAEEYENVENSWTYQEIMDREYVVILDSSCYEYNALSGAWEDKRETNLQTLYDNGIKLKVSGIIRPDKDATATMLTGSIAYTSALTKHVAAETAKSAALAAQMENEDLDIFTGLPFKQDTSNWKEGDKARAYHDYFDSLPVERQTEQYMAAYELLETPQLRLDIKSQVNNMSDSLLRALVAQYAEQLAEQYNMSVEMVQGYLATMDISQLRDMMEEAMLEENLQRERESIEALGPDEAKQKAKNYIDSKPDAEVAQLYDTIKDDESDSTYEQNLSKLGYIDIDTPSVINIYASTFDAKDVIAEEIERYNEGVEDETQTIKYTDLVALVMSAVTTIINAITYVLIAFVSISLVVSSIMVGVITLISVQERTKEIGILRAIGASKRDVSHMFNAETIIIGFAAGLFGVLVTYLLCLPINLILHLLTGINTLSAVLHPVAAVVLILISMFLTVFSGFIPSRSAAKKDPAIALRTE